MLQISYGTDELEANGTARQLVCTVGGDRETTCGEHGSTAVTKL